jgi:hypothetical protein
VKYTLKEFIVGRYTSQNYIIIVDADFNELPLKTGTTNSLPVSVPDGETIPTTLKNVNMQSGVRVPVSR